MPAFIIRCIDRKDQPQLRSDARDAHLAYLEATSDRILLVGPLLDEENRITGSLYLVEADDIAGARSFVDADPFTSAGVFETIDASRFRIHTGKLAA